MHSVAHVGVSVSDEPAHVEAECEEAGPQKVAQSCQVGDGEVVGVHASAPHPVDHPVGQVEKDYHLKEEEDHSNVLLQEPANQWWLHSKLCKQVSMFNTCPFCLCVWK